MTTMNMSDERTDGLHSPCWNIALSTSYILVFLVAVPGNALALWAFCHQKSSSPSKVFLRNLSIADISYVLILPMRVVYHLSDGHWPFGHVLCRLSGFLFYLNMYCSLYLMSFISLDRLLAVVFPLRSQSVRKPLYANVAVVVLWVAVIISMSPTLFSKKDDEGGSPGICKKLYLEKTSPTALVSTVVAFSIPLTTIVSCYILILLKLRKLKREQRSLKDKAVKVVVFVMMTFLVAFLPYHVSRVVYIQSHTRGHVSAASRRSLERANQITSALTCVNGILDPVLYFYLNRAYREKFLHLFCKNRQRDH